MRDFYSWLNTFRKYISDYHYYINFETVYKNTNKYKVELNILNSLIASKEIETDFKNLLEKYPSCLKAIPILLAKREYEIYCMDEKGTFNFSFKNINYSIDDYVYFMKETGLFDLIENHIISNLYDYVLGVNTGLDSNARKNRGGHLMENLCENFIKITGLPYKKEEYIEDIESRTGLDLSSLSNQGDSTKRFDFVIYGKNSTYAVECNFYASSGSKLNEVARSYKNIAQQVEKIPNLTFIWITDGQGWFDAKHNLKETFDILETIYNINDLENNVLKSLS